MSALCSISSQHFSTFNPSNFNLNLQFMMTLQKSLVVFLFLANLLAFVKGQPQCINNGNYTSNSTYHNNLNTLLSRLSTNIDDNGFYNASLGQNTDRVNAYALCLGDRQLDICQSCIRNATDILLQSCPNYRQAFLWREPCMVRYSNTSLFGIVDDSTMIILRNTGNTTDPDQFRSNLTTLINDVRGQASSGGTLRKVAAANRTTSGFQTIFAMLQCTSDLSQQDCDTCLMSSVQQLPGCCYSSPGAQIISHSCYLRYETYRFYNETRLRELGPVPSPPPLAMPSPPQLPPTPSPPQPGGNRTITIIVVVVSVVVGLIILLLVCFFVMKMRRMPKEKAESEAVDISVVESLQYDFGVIKVATNDFSDVNKLGQGGFGAVYKGQLPTGQEIAVKRLSIGSGQGDIEFRNEVMLLVKLQHRNLVRLLGFSFQGSEKLLVYELVQNASLDAFIFDPTKRSLLDWDRRSKIIGGIARGILYLHEDSQLRIIHRDLKASNVLLDGDMNPKIADFGMARLFVPDETQGSTSRIVGTYGYMAPEYAMRGQFSVKSDVFSFGVLLLEIISGQKNNCFRHGDIESDLISSAWEYWRHGTTFDLVDPVLRVGSSTPRDILRHIHIGLLCVQENATDRPTMASIVIMLHSFSITLPVPSSPAFFGHDGYDSESSLLRGLSSGERNLKRSSKDDGVEVDISSNEMSISEFVAR